jgi:hypothetical protein
VVKGLVDDRRQWHLTKCSVLTHRRAPWSYGTNCSVPFDKKKHNQSDENVFDDPFRPGEKRVKNQIDWLVKKVRKVPDVTRVELLRPEYQGQSISTEFALETKYKRSFFPNSANRVFVDKFVVSTDNPQYLPLSITSNSVQLLCTIESNLDVVAEKHFKKIRKHWWSRKVHHFEVDHSIRLVIGPNDL